MDRTYVWTVVIQYYTPPPTPHHHHHHTPPLKMAVAKADIQLLEILEIDWAKELWKKSPLNDVLLQPVYLP